MIDKLLKLRTWEDLSNRAENEESLALIFLLVTHGRREVSLSEFLSTAMWHAMDVIDDLGDQIVSLRHELNSQN